MRVIAGIAKGRRLVTPSGTTTRPPTARMREALFSSLGHVVSEARVLDLFAGSGAFGLEALSRGARTAVFVERSRRARAALLRNIAAVGLGGDAVVEDAHTYLEGSGATFDLVFVDPPFEFDESSLQRVLAAIPGRLAPRGVVIVHRRHGSGPPPAPESLTLVDQRRYGDSELWRFDKEDG